MEAPDFMICLDCETPCYVFEWQGEKVKEIQCLACGNDDPQQFLRPDQLEELES